MKYIDPSLVPRFHPFRKASSQKNSWWSRIFDPSSEFIIQWNRFFLVSCLIAVFLDPLYFYLPSNGGPACLVIDVNLGIIVTFFRTVTDFFYLAHMILKFRTAFVAPSSRVFGRGELVRDPKQIALRYLKSDFVFDLIATLPVPQFIIWFVLPAVRTSNHANNTLAMFVLFQYVPRLCLMVPLNSRIVKATGVVTKTAWAGAAYNLLLYMLASHVLGACWYLLSIGRQSSCWTTECIKEAGSVIPCNPLFLECSTLDNPERQSWLNSTHLLSNCDATNNDNSFKYGMFIDAFTSDVVTLKFVQKYLYCLWWGLKNLSSYGQDLTTSTYSGETSFAILICIMGLVLFAHLIGNMQTYLQSITVRLEEWRVKQRDTEEWMRHRQLPPDLQERVRRFVQYKWLATRGVDEESLLRSLPLDLRRDIQRHLCLALVRRVSFFSQMDDQLLDAICERLVPSLNTQDTYMVREGDPVNEMLFIIRGQLESSTTNGGRSGFFNSITLRPGDFCGEELLTWALMPNSTLNLPSSTRTVKAITEVEAFALRAEDLKFVASQFKRLHSKKLQQAFRFYSHQWRTWAAGYIEVAWRRFKRRKMAKELSKQESVSYMSLLDESQDNETSNAPQNDNSVLDKANLQHLAATVLASRFAANTRRGVTQRPKIEEPDSENLKMPKLFKPADPDFSVNPEEDM